MSQMSEKAREAARSKAERLVRDDPHQRVDASGYKPDGAMDADVQTGPRVISRRQFRRGGKVAGEATAPRADRKPRKAGGRTKIDGGLINEDVKEANEDRDGIKHVGGMKSGGRAHRATGGEVHKDAAQDRKLIHEEMHKSGCGCSKCAGGRVGRASGGGNWIAGAIKHPGSLHRSLHVPEDEKIPAKKLAKAAHSDNPKLARKAHLAETLKELPHRATGGPAFARGGPAINDGTRPMGGRMPRKSGGRAKKGTNVNIIITQPGGVARPPVSPVAPVAAGAPTGLRQGVPPQMAPPMPAAGPPMAMPGAQPPMMPRARGGRTGYPIDAGAGSGLGRLEKAERAARR